MVSAKEFDLTFALYSEDRADADRDFKVLKELLLGMLQQICPELKTNYIRTEPAQPARKERVCGSFWKAKPKAAAGAQEHRRRLIRDVATAVQLGHVVLFHVDADEVWASRARCVSACEHWPAFSRDVLAVLRYAGAPLDHDDLEHAMIVAMPYSEIESWAFANVARLRGILSDPGDLAALAQWEHDLGRLDEIADIKEALSIRDGHTLELVQRRHGFPAAALIEVDKSYAAVVGRLRASSIVAQGLAEASARPY